MVLAAGRGERMGALTEHCPKPLLAVAGKPLLRHLLERLAGAGIREVVINTSYLGDQVADFLARQTDLEMHFAISPEPQRLETGGGIQNALPLLGDAPFLLVNSDVWCDYPLQQLPQALTGLAHLVLVNNPEHHPQGDFGLQGNRVLAQADPGYTFSGISVIHPALFAGCCPGRFPLAPLLREAMAQGLVQGELYSGQWVDVGTPQRLAVVERMLESRTEPMAEPKAESMTEQQQEHKP